MIGRLGISGYDNNRYGIGLEAEGHFYEDPLHCGDCFEVWLDGVWVSVRIEWDGYWYLIDRPRKAIRDAVARCSCAKDEPMSCRRLRDDQ